MAGFRKCMAVWILILGCMGCKNPFSTRKPEPPETAQSQWVPAHSPDQVLLNMQNAIAERNVENYIRCLADSGSTGRVFRFDPDLEVANQFPGMFTRWNLEKEEKVFRQLCALVPKDSVFSLSWEEIQQELTTPDTAVFVRRYRMEIHTPQDRFSLPKVYQGIGEFRLIENTQGEWVIYRWIDNGVSGSKSWSYLKASFGEAL